MASKLRVIPATLDHAADLAAHLRAADRREIEASSGHDPLEAVRHSVEVSHNPWAAVDPRGVVAIWGVGVGSVASSVGYPWMLGTDRLATQYRRELLITAADHVGRMRRQFSYLVNFVDARNTASLRWLRWCGFAIYPPEPFGVSGLPFHRFDLKGIY